MLYVYDVGERFLSVLSKFGAWLESKPLDFLPGFPLPGIMPDEIRTLYNALVNASISDLLIGSVLFYVLTFKLYKFLLSIFGY